MRRIKLVVAYDGTAYAGWQVQPNGVTVQEKIEEAIKKITGETVKIHGSGRTDQGVHAIGQVAHFDLVTSEISFDSLLRGMNAILPQDIRILTVCKAAHDFHARRSAKWKEYRYFIWNDKVIPPHHRLYKTFIRQKLDVKAMNKACSMLIGRHDFSAFTANPNREVESNIRSLTALKVIRKGKEIVIIARSEGFLYKMVRSIAGYLIRVGEGALPPQKTLEILKSRQRTAMVPTAQPHGLFLWKVSY